MARGTDTLIQSASLRLLFGNARERPKACCFLGEQRPIFRRVAFVSRRFLEDLCKTPMLVCRQHHWNHPPRE